MTHTATTSPTPQRIRALERANSVRLARADLKKRIADGRLSAGEIILRNPREVERLTVADLLLSQRRWGATRCKKFLDTVGLTELKLIGDLTERQRRLLAAELEAQQPSGRRHACSEAAVTSMAPVAHTERARALSYV